MTPRAPSRQRGAALLLAMLIVTLVATLAAGMVWQQWKGIEVEAAERARAQATWLIEGATDFSRLILRTDAQDREHPNIDTLNEPWNTPLKDVKLSDFLAADKNNTEDTGLEAFLSGQITDAQSRYNLKNLITDEDADAAKELAKLRRLCEALGIPPETANRIADGMKGADLAEDQLDDEEAVSPGAPLPPQRVQQLTWFGLDADAVRRLAPYVIILPGETNVNLLTAPPEVLVAVLDGLDRGSAERFAQKRLSVDVRTLNDLKPLLPEKVHAQLNDGEANHIGINSNSFEILGELRYENFSLRELTLVTRRGQEVVVLRRERLPHE
ncbi:MAG TPA: type II secretion system minor pseudopilin GspK [Ideonella sp.]|uniref:type II secretion system minor pseudopilin GspK n=1 Tax=Ideonella sp. TaxID=1929293 RepID=UPI002E2FFBFB|nr:type II secretion system minor pseudopilin GspK [Ideonella sp.]HEX5687058.1 type II secretion system minor pseudopilin GspK [Ideonella sp.]